MNVINSYRSVKIYEPNTYIGGVGGYLLTPKDVLNYAIKSVDTQDLVESDIKQFTIDDSNNISFYIEKDYSLRAGAFNGWSGYSPYWPNAITYYYDVDGRCKSASIFTFFNQSNFKYFRLNAVNSAGDRGFSSTNSVLFYFPSLTNISQTRWARSNANLKRMYFPNLIQNLPSDTFTGSTGNIINAVFHPDMATINGGNPAIGIAGMDALGLVTYIDNFTKPSSITDLSVSKTSTTATFNFTSPSSLNPIDFYEIWIEEKNTFNPITRFSPNDFEITASGQTLTGLKPNTEYIAKLATVDIYYNGSGLGNNQSFSNIVEFKTDL